MKVVMNDSTISAIKDSLVARNKTAVRVVIKGFGWGGPTLGVVLDEQKKDDDVFELEGIKVVADNEFAFMLGDLTINYSKGLFGSSFKVSSAFSGGSCS